VGLERKIKRAPLGGRNFRETLAVGQGTLQCRAKAAGGAVEEERKYPLEGTMRGRCCGIEKDGFFLAPSNERLSSEG